MRGRVVTAGDDPLQALLKRLGLVRTLVSGAEAYAENRPGCVVLIFNVCALPLVESAVSAVLGELQRDVQDEWPRWLGSSLGRLQPLRESQDLLWNLDYGLWMYVMPWEDGVTVSVRLGLSDEYPPIATRWLHEGFGVA